MAGTLFLVGTPIGNLEDLSDRARRVLSEADLVAAEDTRRTGRLLEHIGAKKPLLSVFEGNETERILQLLERLRAGENVALVSDAGMPSVSDPGYELVTACIEAGIAVDVVPGPSAVLSGLVLSGLPTDRFVFEGFLPRTGSHRKARLAALAEEPRTIVLFESPQRVERTLRDIARTLGDRRVVVARELTKLHQEVIRGRISEVLARTEGRELKGEIVVVVEGATRADKGRAKDTDRRSAVDIAATLVAQGMRKRDAARAASGRTGVPASVIYDELVRGPRPGTG
jgi:16S rRNA (cytidine1402-2'-O)-methyltransferase